MTADEVRALDVAALRGRGVSEQALSYLLEHPELGAVRIHLKMATIEPLSVSEGKR